MSSAGTVHKVTDQSFDGQGRLVCTAVRMNPNAFSAAPGACALGAEGSQGPDRITRNHYDPAGQLLKVEKAVGTLIRQDYAKYEYTPNGQRKAVIDANGNRAEMTWDGHGRQTRWIFPSNTPGLANPADYEEYGYDPIGNRTSLRKRDGSVLTYAYDNLNRVIRKTVPERAGLTAAQTRDVYYDYNHALGLQTRARFDGLDGEGVTTFYDQFGLRKTVLLNMGGLERYLFYWHDDAGNLGRLTHGDGVHFGYGYDARGRAIVVHDNAWAGSYDDYVARFGYKPEGPRHSAVRGAGDAFTSVFFYDALQQPVALYNDLPTPGGDLNLTLDYNPASQIVRRTSDNDAYAWTGHYNVSRTYQVNGLNQYTAAGPATFTYDPNGNLTSDGTTSYTYDVENRLVSSSAGASLVYDPLGRLVQTSGGAAGITRFNYDGDKLVAEYDGAGTLLRRYVHGPGVDEPLAVYEGAALGGANRRYLIPDERGSIVARVRTDGSALQINTYDSWGIPGAANGGRFQYTGQTWLPELGMYYYKARIYSPTLGRFLQTDPIGYDDQVNLYAYVGNDPVNLNDPDGLKKVATCEKQGPQGCESIVIDGPGKLPFGTAAPTPTGNGDRHGRRPPAPPNPCSPPPDDAFLEKSLDVMGLVGDGMAVVGLLTGNPVLVGVGVGLSAISTVGQAALHADQGDATGLAIDAGSFAVGRIPGGQIARRLGGARADWGRRANGRYRDNWNGRKKAQDTTAQGLQQQASNQTANAVRCAR